MGGGGATLGSSGAHPAELLSVSGLGRGGHGEDTPVPAWSEEVGLPTAGNRWANPRGSNTPLRKSRTPGTRWPPPAPAPDLPGPLVGLGELGTPRPHLPHSPGVTSEAQQHGQLAAAPSPAALPTDLCPPCPGTWMGCSESPNCGTRLARGAGLRQAQSWGAERMLVPSVVWGPWASTPPPSPPAPPPHWRAGQAPSQLWRVGKGGSHRAQQAPLPAAPEPARPSRAPSRLSCRFFPATAAVGRWPTVGWGRCSQQGPAHLPSGANSKLPALGLVPGWGGA